MRRLTLFKLETPYREPMLMQGFEFGDQDGTPACAIVGSMRGNEVQQDYICARLVGDLARAERDGFIARGKKVLIVPCVNPFSLNLGQRFWPMDKSDINRMFPGSALGETTERVADGLFRAVRGYELGLQLCSFYLPGEFVPHVRVNMVGQISRESLEMAKDLRLPYVVESQPDPFDTTMLNYNWQVWGTHALSLYSRTTDALDEHSARQLRAAVLRFLGARGVLVGGVSMAGDDQGVDPLRFKEAELVNVRAEQAGGFLMSTASVGNHVKAGQRLAQVVDVLDATVKETLTAPVSGTVFLARVRPLAQQRSVCYRILPDGVGEQV